MAPAPEGSALDALIGTSAAILALKRRVARAIPSAAAVLIEGETGTGKELLARALHAGGARRDAPFVPVNCGALAGELVDAELFGHERGAFTGAVGRRPGRAAEAHGGTLFLDEVGELAPAVQCKLLRLLQEGEVQRVGADRPLRVDVRIVAATNRDLRALVARGGFRADCYYRLSAVVLRVPPLRARGRDVVLLAARFAARSARELGRTPPRLSAEAEAVLLRHAWPGNVRELENVMRELVLYGDGPSISADEVRAVLTAAGAATAGTSPAAGAAASGAGCAAPDAGVDAARAVTVGPAPDLAAVLRRCGGNLSAAARALGVSRPTLYKRVRLLGIDLAAWRQPAPRSMPLGTTTMPFSLTVKRRRSSASS